MFVSPWFQGCVREDCAAGHVAQINSIQRIEHINSVFKIGAFGDFESFSNGEIERVRCRRAQRVPANRIRIGPPYTFNPMHRAGVPAGSSARGPARWVKDIRVGEPKRTPSIALQRVYSTGPLGC